MSTFCHGIAAAQSLDKSGEIVDIKGLDISSLASTGIVNYEHKSDIPGQICGKILTAKKIFNKESCSNDRELYFWNKTKNPFVYITAELLDDYCQSGKDAAGILRYDYDKKEQNKHAILGFSIEGSEIPNSRGSNKMVVARGIARKTTLTSAPCNTQCIAELLIDSPKSQVKDDFEELFKTDEEAITLFKSGEGEKIYEQFLAKKEHDSSHDSKIGKTKSGKEVYSHKNPHDYDFDNNDHKDAAEHHRHAAVTSSDSSSVDHHLEQMKAHNRAALGNLNKGNVYDQKGVHKPPLPGIKGGMSVMGSHVRKPSDHGVGSKEMARRHAKQVLNEMKQMPKPNLTKAESFGWSPGKVDREKSAVHFSHPEHGTVTIQKQPDGEFHVKHQGALAGVEGVKGSFKNPKEANKHAKKYMQGISQGKILSNKLHNRPSPSMLGKGEIKKAITAGSYNAAPGTLVDGAAYQVESRGSVPRKDWNKQAKDDYERWPHREKFEKFMSARMPHLAMGEIRALGRVLALKKTIDIEKSLESLILAKSLKK